MKNFLIKLFVLILLCGTIQLNAQCPGQTEIRIDVTTDGFGYELYWELVPSGNACGVGTIASGGSSVVGCNGGGAQAQNQTVGYGNNITYNEGPWCLTTGASYDIIFVDDWGDGGGEFEVKANGYVIKNFEAMTGSNLVFTFVAQEPPAFDIGVYNVTEPYLYDAQGNKDIKGVFFNYGTATVNTLDLNYQIDSDPIQTVNLTGLNLTNFQVYNYSHPNQWSASLGLHTLKVWTSNINGNNDLNNTNDTISKTIEIGAGIPNIIDSYLSITPIITQIGNSSDQLDKPIDLDFHPSLAKRQLWVINKRLEGNGGSTVIYDNAGLVSQTDQMKVDGNAWHFMSLPTGMAFSKNGNWANSPGVYDANHNAGAPFTGPALWSGDLNIYAEPSGGNGSHLDMLHASPYSQGIASEKDNVYWVFDGYSNDIVRYDFVEDHGPGNSFHGDAIIHRYNDFAVAKDPNGKVPSHLVVSDGWVYVVDYGNDKVFRIQLNTGTIGATPAFGPFETVADYKYVTGYTWENVVTTGLQEPTGIDVIGDRMIISDYATSEIIIYDISTIPAVELGRINTGATGIMGVKIGPEGKIWYVDYDANTVNIIEGNGLSVDEEIKSEEISIYPNPVNNVFNVSIKGSQKDVVVKVFDLTGKIIFEKTLNNNSIKIDASNWANGVYNIQLSNDNNISYSKLIVSH